MTEMACPDCGGVYFCACPKPTLDKLVERAEREAALMDSNDEEESP